MTNPTLFPAGNALVLAITPLFHWRSHITRDGTFHFRFTHGKMYLHPLILPSDNQNNISAHPPSLFLCKTGNFSSIAFRLLENNANIFWLQSHYDPRISSIRGFNAGFEKKIVITIVHIHLIVNHVKVVKMLSTYPRKSSPLPSALSKLRYRATLYPSPVKRAKLVPFKKTCERRLERLMNSGSRC